jgi:hypothetical protein
MFILFCVNEGVLICPLVICCVLCILFYFYFQPNHENIRSLFKVWKKSPCVYIETYNLASFKGASTIGVMHYFHDLFKN